MSDVLKPSVLRQCAVYWPPIQIPESGRYTYGIPVQIRCRWTDKAQQFLDKDGNTQTSKAIVLVDRDLILLGVLWLGNLASLSTDQRSSPLTNTSAYEIRGMERIPNRRANKFLRRALL